MKITGQRTRGVFERYNITDQTDTHQAGRMAEEFLHENMREDCHKQRRTDGKG